MTLLAIESATDMVGVALVRDDGASAERLHFGGRAHAELLIPSVEEVCAVSGCTVADLDVIAVDRGPGLFTGLRVGVATAKALGQALSIGLVGVSSLDVLAAAAFDRFASHAADPPGALVSVVDARRGEVFAAAYRIDGARGLGDPVDPASVRDERAEPITPGALERWVVELAGLHGRVAVVGDGAVRYRSQLAAHPGVDLDTATELAAPPPATLARLARDRLGRGQPPTAAGDLVPDYRRPADARINWEQRAPRTTRTAGEGPR